jgi:AbrB family looped-hinge helix DNA binding protein
MPTSQITSKGQTTIPKEIREYLNLKSGDRVDFVIDEHGRVVLKPATLDVSELEGILYRPNRKAVSTEEMKKTIKDRFRKKKG